MGIHGFSGLRSYFTTRRQNTGLLTRISHQLSAAAADPGMATALRPVGFLDVLSSTPAESSRRVPCIHACLRRRATKPGEKCGLTAKICDSDTGGATEAGAPSRRFFEDLRALGSLKCLQESRRIAFLMRNRPRLRRRRRRRGPPSGRRAANVTRPIKGRPPFHPEPPAPGEGSYGCRTAARASRAAGMRSLATSSRPLVPREAEDPRGPEKTARS